MGSWRVAPLLRVPEMQTHHPQKNAPTCLSSQTPTQCVPLVSGGAWGWGRGLNSHHVSLDARMDDGR